VVLSVLNPPPARAVSLDLNLELKQVEGGGVEVVVPEVPIHEIVTFNLA
jgi:hypothetical protein